MLREKTTRNNAAMLCVFHGFYSDYELQRVFTDNEYGDFHSLSDVWYNSFLLSTLFSMLIYNESSSLIYSINIERYLLYNRK